MRWKINYFWLAVTCIVAALIWWGIFTAVANAQHLHHEADYQNSWCFKMGGDIEYRLPDSTRVDCLTEDYAIEFDFAEKWAEAIGQALYYANITGREPGIVLLVEDAEHEFKYLIRLLKSIEASPRAWRVWIMEPGDLN